MSVSNTSFVPRRVVAKKASSPGEVDRSNFMLRASSIVQIKNGVQHTRKHTEIKKYLKIKISQTFMLRVSGIGQLKQLKKAH
jgi:hypothetical protein